MASIDAAGRARDYILYVPPQHDGSTPVPLVLDLHGRTLTARRQVSMSGLRPLAESEGYVYVAPDGLADPSGMGNAWSDRSGSSMDLVFLRALIADIGARGCIDERRIYVTGCSNGGSMTNLVMCWAEAIVAAVAPICGTTFFNLERQCSLERPVSTLLVIGTEDALNCREVEEGSIDPELGVTCVKNYQDIMVQKLGCKGQVTTTGVCERIDQCEGGTEVMVCSPNIGHIVYRSTELNVAQEIWGFLKRFRLP